MPLSDEQQIAIASAMRGPEGLRLRDHAWRTKGLGDLVSTPLYLRALMETDGDVLPETKQEVIGGFIRTHENHPANAEMFRSQLHGEHRSYLMALAVSAQESGTPALSESDAITAIGAVTRRLVDEGIVPAGPAARQVLDILVAAHSLVPEGEVIAFQHQQIQEWFASIDLDADLMAAGKLSIEHPLVIKCLNDASWCEVVLFACERMSRRDESSRRVVADMVCVLLTIDPRFAAQVIALGGSMVWNLVEHEVVKFAVQWMTISKDRALGFMIESQRPEFAHFVWPLATNESDQTQMKTMRSVHRFNPKVLGDYPDKELAKLSERRRTVFLGELASHGDQAGMELAHRLALSDPSVRVRQEVFEDLSFRRATHLLEDLLRQSGDSLMEAVAERGYFEGIVDEELEINVKSRRKVLTKRDMSPEARVAMALKSQDDEELAAVARLSFAEASFPMRDRGAQLIYDASLRVPIAVGTALAERAINGLELPYRPYDLLDRVPVSDSQELAHRILKQGVIERDEAPVLYLAGSGIVGELLTRFLAARRQFALERRKGSGGYEPVRMLADALERTRATVLIEVIIAQDDQLSSADIGALSHVISAHGKDFGRETIGLDGNDRVLAVALLNSWGERLLAEPADRGDLASLTWAMRRLPDATEVEVTGRMLQHELSERRKLRAAFEADNRNQAALNAWRHSHEHEYRTVLTTIGTWDAHDVLAGLLCDPDFGLEAAVGMQIIWQETYDPQPPERFPSRFPDFDRVAKARAQGRSTLSETAALILAEARNSAAAETPASRNRGATMAGCAVLLPHGEQGEFLFGLLQGGLAPRVQLDLARRMVLGGYILQSSTILASISSLIAERSPEWRFLNDNDGWDLFDWLALLPASDDPASLIKGVELLFDLQFYRSRILPEFRGLRLLAEEERISIMRGIVAVWPEYVEQHEFYDALSAPSVRSLDLIVDAVTGRIGQGRPQQGMRYDYAESLFFLLQERDRNTLLDRYKASTDSREQEFLGQMLLASGEHGVFVALMATEVGRKIIAQSPYGARERLLYTKQPHEDASVYELIPRNVDQLRSGLFDLVLSDDADASAFAARYLDRIDGEREAEGILESGRRHPNIETGQPWPLLL